MHWTPRSVVTIAHTQVELYITNPIRALVSDISVMELMGFADEGESVCGRKLGEFVRTFLQ
jgi:hypothetical protein